MAPNNSCTRHFRLEHIAVRRSLDAIEAELSAIAPGSAAAITRSALSHLDILLEHDLERHLEDEERLLYPALAQHTVGDDSLLHQCYQDHGDIRLRARSMRELLAKAHAMYPDAAAKLRECAERMITLIRAHMQREDDLLFPQAESILGRLTLERRDASGHDFPGSAASPDPRAAGHRKELATR